MRQAAGSECAQFAGIARSSVTRTGPRDETRRPSRSRVALQQPTDVLHQQLEVERVGGGWLEAVLEVPGLGAVVLGVDEQDARADRLGGLRRAQNGVLEHGAADAGALVAFVHGESREQDRRDGSVAWLTLERPCG